MFSKYENSEKIVTSYWVEIRIIIYQIMWKSTQLNLLHLE